MKKIGFITKNRILAQSLSYFIKNSPDLPFDVALLLNPSQVALDAEVMNIDIAVVEISAETERETMPVITLCEELRRAVPACRILLLVPKDDRSGRDTAITAVDMSAADDYIFLDESLDYLFTKLLSL